MKRSKKATKTTEDDDDDDIWEFKQLKRTRKKITVKPKDADSAKTSQSTSKLKRRVSKVAAERLKSQLEGSNSEDSDCLIVSTNEDDCDFKENRKRAFLSSSVINGDQLSKSSISTQSQLLVDKDELSQKLKKSPHSSKMETQKITSAGSKKKSVPKKLNDAAKRNKNKDEKGPTTAKSGRCPICQVPFSALLRLSPNAHTMECMDLPLLPNIEECPDGLSCSSKSPSHYRKYTHKVLAQHRAETDEGSENERETITSGPGDGDEPIHSEEFASDEICIEKLCMPKSTSDNKSASNESSQSYRSLLREPGFDKSESMVLAQAESKTGKSAENSSRFKCDEDVSSSSEDFKETKTRDMNVDSSDSDELDNNSKIKTESHSMKIIVNDDVTSNEKIETDVENPSKETNNEDVEGGGFLVISDDEDDKDLTDLLAGSENEEDGNDTDEEENEDDDIGDTGVEVDDTADDDTEVADLCCSNKTDIDNTCDTGFNDETNDNDDKDDTEGGTLETDEFMQSRNDNEMEICDSKKQSESDDTKTSLSMSQGENIFPSLARKQTSIFSFFNCPKKSSDKNSSQPLTDLKCDINDLRKGLSKIASMPSVSGLRSETGLPLKRVSSDITSERSKATEHIYEGGRGGKKMCPFYKKIPDTPLTVDAFRYGVIPGCRAYILTHFHYDHYGGLTKHFKQPLYCSKVTGNLVRSKIKVDPRYIHTLPLNEPRVVEGVELTLMEANHCPGAVIILFRLKSGQTFLHTGDFRADPAMESYPPLVGTKIHQLYLDTTYCDPAYSFPSQTDVIGFAVSLVQKHLEACPNSLIVCGSYTIGKERIFLAIAEALKSKVCVKRDKKQILDCLENPRLENRITLVPAEAQVHVLPMGKLNPNNLSEYLSQNHQFTSVLAIEPTGWSHSNRVVSLDQIRPKYSRNAITIYGVPYSEHSSYLEMKRFTQFVRPDRILPTVNNGNPQSRKKMEDIFRKWMAEIKQDSVKKETMQINRQSSLKSWFS